MLCEPAKLYDPDDICKLVRLGYAVFEFSYYAPAFLFCCFAVLIYRIYRQKEKKEVKRDKLMIACLGLCGIFFGFLAGISLF